MKAINWIRFTWDLNLLPEAETGLPAHYQIAPAQPADEKELRLVIARSFTLDPSWSPALEEAMRSVDAWIERAHQAETSVFLALRHGVRIIGAAVVCVDPAADNHLAPGPCVLVEYRNRGFGLQLLERSLATLRQAGLAEAVAITKANAPVAKFLYSKFGGAIAPIEFVPALAA